MKIIQFAVALLAAYTGLIHAQVVTAPVGFVSVTVQPQSDVALGAPLNRAEEFQGVIQSISGNTLTVAGTPGWTANQFVYASGTQPKTYYARIDSGAKEGLIATISSNGTGSVTVTLPSGEDLTNISTNAALVSPATTGDSISIAPYWTPASLVTGVVAGTQLLVYPTNIPGINLAAVTYVFNGTNWLQGATNVNDVAFQFGQGLTLRNNSTSVQTISITGSVPMTGHRLLIKTLASTTRQDVRFFYSSPVPETIGNVGLGFAPGDQLLFTDNAATGRNKAATTLTWNGSNWLQGATVVTTTFQLQPGVSYIYRKNQTATPTNFVWSDLQSYLQ
jgi:uncharacterized protein (TIGR02597 family)